MTAQRRAKSSKRFNPLAGLHDTRVVTPKRIPRPAEKSVWDVPINPRPPITLHDLDCVRTLGAGEFGKVLLVSVRAARDGHPVHQPGTLLAIKALNKKVTRAVDWEYPADKNVERMALSRVPWSPFVCGMLDAMYDVGNLYISLEHLSCGTLTMAINHRGPFDDATARFYYANIVCGLNFLHKLGVAHRDLKPDNILMGPDGYLCITDFGAATTDWEDKSHTEVGTPCYQTPESISYPHRYHAPSADWWASGCIIYEMLCRALMFPGSSRKITHTKIINLHWAWPKGVKVGKDINEILVKLLHPDPAERLGAVGATEVKSQPWLRGIDWAKLEARKYLAPYVPAMPTPVDDWHKHPVPNQSKVPDLNVIKPLYYHPRRRQHQK